MNRAEFLAEMDKYPLLPAQRIRDFIENPSTFTDYDVFFLSGIVGGLNERRFFVNDTQAISHGRQFPEGGITTPYYSLCAPVDLYNDILKPCSDDFGTELKELTLNGSGIVLSKKLLNILRYWTIDTAMACVYNVPTLPQEIYPLFTAPRLENWTTAQAYYTHGTKTLGHYPLDSPEDFTYLDLENGKIPPRKNIIDVSSDPDKGSFYNELAAKLIGPSGSYGGGSLETQGLESLPSNSAFLQWRNKGISGQNSKDALLPYEKSLLGGDSILPTAGESLTYNEYFSENYPKLHGFGNAFLAQSGFFFQLVDVIANIQTFMVPLSYHPFNQGENPLIFDKTDKRGLTDGEQCSCNYRTDAWYLCDCYLHEGGGGTCCSLAHFDCLQLGDCGVWQANPCECPPVSYTTYTTSTDYYYNPFPDIPNPVDYSEKSASAGNTISYTVHKPMHYTSAKQEGTARMRPKILSCKDFKGKLSIAYQEIKSLSQTCYAYLVTPPCTSYSQTDTTFRLQTITSINKSGTSLLQCSEIDAVAPYQNCSVKCNIQVGGSQTASSRLYLGFVGIAEPIFDMLKEKRRW